MSCCEAEGGIAALYELLWACAGPRDERGQFLYELRRLEDQVGRAVGEGAAQRKTDQAIAQQLQAVMRERWAQHVPTDTLALVAVV